MISLSRCPCRGETAANGDLIVIPDDQGTQGFMRRIAVGVDHEMVFRA
jgi:hypothetical protein